MGPADTSVDQGERQQRLVIRTNRFMLLAFLFLTRAHAEGLAADDHDDLRDRLVDRLLEGHLQRASLENTSLAKAWSTWPQQRTAPPLQQQQRRVITRPPRTPPNILDTPVGNPNSVPVPYHMTINHNINMPTAWSPHEVFPFAIPAHLHSQALLRASGHHGHGTGHHKTSGFGHQTSHRRRHPWATVYPRIIRSRSEEGEEQEEDALEIAAAAAEAARQIVSQGAAAGAAMAADAAAQAAAKAREKIRARRAAIAAQNNTGIPIPSRL
jgi:hypothetical protein